MGSLLWTCLILGALQMTSATIKGYSSEDEDIECKTEGEFLLHPTNRCKFVHCTLSAEMGGGGKHLVKGMVKDCPTGTSVPRAQYQKNDIRDATLTSLCTEIVLKSEDEGICDVFSHPGRKSLSGYTYSAYRDAEREPGATYQQDTTRGHDTQRTETDNMVPGSDIGTGSRHNWYNNLIEKLRSDLQSKPGTFSSYDPHQEDDHARDLLAPSGGNYHGALAPERARHQEYDARDPTHYRPSEKRYIHRNTQLSDEELQRSAYIASQTDLDSIQVREPLVNIMHVEDSGHGHSKYEPRNEAYSRKLPGSRHAFSTQSNPFRDEVLNITPNEDSFFSSFSDYYGGSAPNRDAFWKEDNVPDSLKYEANSGVRSHKRPPTTDRPNTHGNDHSGGAYDISAEGYYNNRDGHLSHDYNVNLGDLTSVAGHSEYDPRNEGYLKKMSASRDTLSANHNPFRDEVLNITPNEDNFFSGLSGYYGDLATPSTSSREQNNARSLKKYGGTSGERSKKRPPTTDRPYTQDNSHSEGAYGSPTEGFYGSRNGDHSHGYGINLPDLPKIDFSQDPFSMDKEYKLNSYNNDFPYDQSKFIGRPNSRHSSMKTAGKKGGDRFDYDQFFAEPFNYQYGSKSTPDHSIIMSPNFGKLDTKDDFFSKNPASFGRLESKKEFLSKLPSSFENDFQSKISLPYGDMDSGMSDFFNTASSPFDNINSNNGFFTKGLSYNVEAGNTVNNKNNPATQAETDRGYMDNNGRGKKSYNIDAEKNKDEDVNVEGVTVEPLNGRGFPLMGTGSPWNTQAYVVVHTTVSPVMEKSNQHTRTKAIGALTDRKSLIKSKSGRSYPLSEHHKQSYLFGSEGESPMHKEGFDKSLNQKGGFNKPLNPRRSFDKSSNQMGGFSNYNFDNSEWSGSNGYPNSHKWPDFDDKFWSMDGFYSGFDELYGNKRQQQAGSIGEQQQSGIVNSELSPHTNTINIPHLPNLYDSVQIDTSSNEADGTGKDVTLTGHGVFIGLNNQHIRRPKNRKLQVRIVKIGQNEDKEPRDLGEKESPMQHTGTEKYELVWEDTKPSNSAKETKYDADGPRRGGKRFFLPRRRQSYGKLGKSKKQDNDWDNDSNAIVLPDPVQKINPETSLNSMEHSWINDFMAGDQSTENKGAQEETQTGQSTGRPDDVPTVYTTDALPVSKKPDARQFYQASKTLEDKFDNSQSGELSKDKPDDPKVIMTLKDIPGYYSKKHTKMAHSFEGHWSDDINIATTPVSILPRDIVGEDGGWDDAATRFPQEIAGTEEVKPGFKFPRGFKVKNSSQPVNTRLNDYQDQKFPMWPGR